MEDVLMAVRARVICENAVYGTLGAVAEHGWSVWLETASGPFLFDTGQGRSILNNARVFGLPLEEARAILISHHHIDHTGGLLETIHAMRWKSDRATVPVHAHPDLFKESFYESEGTREFIGVPHTRGALETAGARFILEAGWQELAPGVGLSGEVPRRTAFERGDQELRHYDESGNLVVDPVRDDQTVVIDTADGMFVILGCSHAGLINILTYITEQTGASRFHTVMGGTHLGSVSEAQVEHTIAALHDFDIGRIGVSHCTGQKVAARLAREFGERFFFCSVGTVVEA
jgi:7,8-dihydropterin-6-yl-methyl-4-(beta-D-ribofuranosyl)aminobenzene 5'-phosphate synthase